MEEFRCAGCYIEIDYEEGHSLCPECIEELCHVKVSWEDSPDDEDEYETIEKHEENL